MEGEEDEESKTGEKKGRAETPVCLVCAALFLSFLFLTACALCLDVSVCSLVDLPLGGRGSRGLGGGGRGLGKCPGRQ